jgi:GAF domain-containing protein
VEFTITALNGDSVKVESENWMTAMGKALAFFDIEISSIGKLTCSPARDGSVFIEDPTGNRSWMIRQSVADIAVRVTPRSRRESWVAPAEPQEVVRTKPASPPPGFDMPHESSLRAISLSDRAAELLGELMGATREYASARILEVIREYVRSGAACVAVGSLHDPALQIVAAEGRRTSAVLSREVAFGEGLIGMCFDMRGTLLVGDVASDTPHLDQLDPVPPTVAVLCVPLLEDDEAYGVVQLINPADRPFTRAHVEVVETLARTLAQSLAGPR